MPNYAYMLEDLLLYLGSRIRYSNYILASYAQNINPFTTAGRKIDTRTFKATPPSPPHDRSSAIHEEVVCHVTISDQPEPII